MYMCNYVTLARYSGPEPLRDICMHHACPSLGLAPTPEAGSICFQVNWVREQQQNTGMRPFQETPVLYAYVDSGGYDCIGTINTGAMII